MHPTFHVFAGFEVAYKEHDEVLRRCGPKGGEALTAVQEDLHERGIRAARLARGAKGWYVRSATGLDDFAVVVPSSAIPAGNDSGFAGAVEAARKWVEGEPARRYAFTTGTAWGTNGESEF